eukprot:1253414-Alexandrium_andersonii.AAC.1
MTWSCRPRRGVLCHCLSSGFELQRSTGPFQQLFTHDLAQAALMLFQSTASTRRRGADSPSGSRGDSLADSGRSRLPQ